MRFKRVSTAVCLAIAAVLFSGCGDQGWVRTSPDGQYVTIVRKPPDAPADSEDTELALYHIDRRQTTPIVRSPSIRTRPTKAGFTIASGRPTRALCASLGFVPKNLPTPKRRRPRTERLTLRKLPRLRTPSIA